MKWTAEMVRHELPDVSVVLGNGCITRGQLAGRINKFATINLPEILPGGGGFECSWDTIANVLNNNRRIKA